MATFTFEQGWAARPFKEQFPELSEEKAKHLDDLNRVITAMLFEGMLTDSEKTKIRQKRFPKVVANALSEANRGKKKG